MRDNNASPKTEIIGNANIIGDNNQIHMAKAKGDIIYQVLSQSPVLSNYIRIKQFQSLVNERTRGFVGRNFVFNAIDRFIKSPEFPSGYITIQGEPGIGKTSLLAYLIKQRGYLHHFNIASQNITTTQDFLGNLCAQLIVSCKLNYPTLPPESLHDSGFLSQLIYEAKLKLNGTPLIILVDALDEAEDIGLPPNANILYLPQSLPNGVYFVVTMREKCDNRLAVDRLQSIYLKDIDPANLEDVKKYIRNFALNNQAQMAQRIADWNVGADEFIEIITDKSQGNFMYLVHVLGNILDGRLTSTNLDNIHNLPNGLHAYYQRHWRMMRVKDQELFDKYYEPIICMLATAREPVAILQLAEWTKLPSKSVQQVIQEWREFLNIEQDQNNISLYRIYHASFQDFLQDEVGLNSFHNIIVQDALGKIRM